MRNVIIGFSCLVLWFGSLCNATAASSKPNILILGDSISAGYGLRLAQSWPSLLQNKLDKLALNYRVINASVSGDTSRTALNRLPKSLVLHQPFLVIIELGGNDGLRGIPLDELSKSLEKIIMLSKQNNAKVLLLGMKLPDNFGKTFNGLFQAVYKKLAQKHNIPLVPELLVDLDKKEQLFQADQLHPNAQAQPILLDTLWPKLEALIDY